MTKDRAECQVCERRQAINNNDGKMVHHGYRRPGIGEIVGDCFGVGHRPFPATDALEAWMKWLVNEQANLEKRIRETPDATELWVRDYNTRNGVKKIMKVDFMIADKPWLAYEWDVKVSNKVYQLEQELRFVVNDQKRVAARIQKGQEMVKEERQDLQEQIINLSKNLSKEAK